MIKFFQSLIGNTDQSVVSYLVSENNTTIDNKQLIVEMGQSNMEGRDGDTDNVDYPFPVTDGFEWTGSEEIQLTTQRGGVGGSHANYFAEKYIQLSSYIPIMIECSEGGAGLTNVSDGAGNNWANGGGLRGITETKVNSALINYNLQEPIAGLWCQGERDAQEIDSNIDYDKSNVKVAMKNLIDWWFNLYPNSVFIISELGDVGTSDNTKGWQDVRTIQNELATENERVYIGFNNAKNFGVEGKMSDNLHYNFIGYKEMGESLATKLNSLL